eukprot:CAMPEP_0173128094 /NCGR_PEP_ID=MMETSP1102-20130122/58267_1 /TAXON_ID=49646 /ORGANISM="Geminigera sp., Strain Caron Lab Isolate" /LENGTH=507 /DNA_ID=CAMNT_0014038007 /DNA_START=68 /DNA_END=1591 /DNA_ORIENTATION=+
MNNPGGAQSAQNAAPPAHVNESTPAHAPAATPAPVLAPASSAAAVASAPAPLAVQDQVTSRFDIAAREANKVKDMEDRTRVVRDEQKRKKEHQKTVKQGLEEDKIIRKMKPIVRLAKNLSVEELKTHAETIVAFMTENGRPCDDLVEMKYTLLAHAENAQQNPSATAAPVAARSQVTHALQSDQALQVLHDFVTERQGGDSSFSFIVPGPPGLRQELGEEKLGSSLEELGLAPSASLTVQATSKKDMVTVAPEGSEFISTQTQRMGGMPRGGRGMPSIHMGRTQMSGPQSGRALPAGMHVHDDEEDEEEYEDEEQEDGMDVEGAHGAGAPLTPQEEEEAFARAQTESMDVATDAHFDSRDRGIVLGGGATGGNILGGIGDGGSVGRGGSAQIGTVLGAVGGVTVGGGGPQTCALDDATLASIDSLDLTKVKIPNELLDPLTQQLMKDPVKLPCSGSTMDRSTIMRHLRTNPTDPYTNTALSASNLCAATELAPKYKAWLIRCQSSKK